MPSLIVTSWCCAPQKLTAHQVPQLPATAFGRPSSRARPPSTLHLHTEICCSLKPLVIARRFFAIVCIDIDATSFACQALYAIDLGDHPRSFSRHISLASVFLRAKASIIGSLACGPRFRAPPDQALASFGNRIRVCALLSHSLRGWRTDRLCPFRAQRHPSRKRAQMRRRFRRPRHIQKIDQLASSSLDALSLN